MQTRVRPLPVRKGDFFSADGCETEDHGLDRDTCSVKSCGDCDISATSLGLYSKASGKLSVGRLFV